MAPLLANPAARSHRSLSGDWHFILDPYDRGEGVRFYECRRGGPGELVEYDFETSDTLEVPGDWNTQRAELFHYEGVAWYQRRFEARPTPGRRSFLRFGAVCYRASVWVNGQAVGEHTGGFTPFAVEVTDVLRSDEENTLVLKVDSLHGTGDVPTRVTDWKHYGGPTRDVLLVDVPETYVDQIFLQLAPGRTDRLEGFVQLDGARLEQSVRVEIPELGIDQAFPTDAAGLARIAIDARPELWQPGAARLYDVSFHADGDVLGERIGFRTLEVRGTDILVNGEPVFLRGISVHEESILRGGRAHGQDDAQSLLGLAQELGANFVRLAHYPHDESMARAADALGLLVWEEIPLYWSIAWDDPETFTSARSQLTELVERDRNRASVVLWSISNETPPGEARSDFLAKLAAHVRELDPTRLVTSALFGNLGALLGNLRTFIEAGLEGTPCDPPTIVIDDDLAEHLDVVGWNQYLGWYYSAFLSQAQKWPERRVREIVLGGMAGFRVEVPSGKPLVVSEFGAGAKQGRRGDALDVWSEDYQAHVYRQQLAMLSRVPALRGLSPWILKDFRTPIRWLPGVQDGWNRKGLVSETGERKLAFDVLREAYDGQAREAERSGVVDARGLAAAKR